MDKYELGIAVQKIYDFIWDDYCDWYIELTKARLYADDEGSKTVAQQVLVYVLDQFLRLLHPFMPFITEEIWQAIPHDGESLMIASWPVPEERLNFPAEESAMESIMEAIRAVRNRRAEMNVPPSKKSTLYIVTDKQDVFRQGQAFILKLAYADQLVVGNTAPDGADDMVSCVTHDAKMFMPMDQLVDLEKELQRLEKELTKNRKNLEGVEKKLSNPGFLAKAPEQVVAAEREKAEKLGALIQQLEESYQKLKK